MKTNTTSTSPALLPEATNSLVKIPMADLAMISGGCDTQIGATITFGGGQPPVFSGNINSTCHR